MSAFTKLLEAPRVVDSLRVLAPRRLLSRASSMKYTINGKPPTAEDIMVRFGVDRDYADAFLRRNA